MSSGRETESYDESWVLLLFDRFGRNAELSRKPSDRDNGTQFCCLDSGPRHPFISGGFSGAPSLLAWWVSSPEAQQRRCPSFPRQRCILCSVGSVRNLRCLQLSKKHKAREIAHCFAEHMDANCPCLACQKDTTWEYHLLLLVFSTSLFLYLTEAWVEADDVTVPTRNRCGTWASPLSCPFFGLCFPDSSCQVRGST